MVSVCIPTYNGEKYIKDQLLSILNQLEVEDEVVISDDGSDDNTIEIINNIDDVRIRIIKHFPNTNTDYRFDLTTRNVENAFRHAKGNIIFLADQDDIWMEGKVKIVKNLLRNYDLVLHDCKVVNDKRDVINESYFKIINSKKGIVKNLTKNSYLGCCMAFNRSILESKAMPFPKRSIPHDIWIGLIFEVFGKVYFLKDALVEYRRHGDNLSPSSEKSKNKISFRLLYRWIIFKELIKRILNN